jgi:hypothetical protein
VRPLGVVIDGVSEAWSVNWLILGSKIAEGIACFQHVVLYNITS